MNKELLHNSIKCPDGTIITSRHQHDYVEHVQVDGRVYFVDGGLSYQRIGHSDKEFTDLSVYSNQPHIEIREGLEWGRNFDENMKPLPEVEYIKLKDITDDHLEAILRFVIGEDKVRKVLLDEKDYRLHLLTQR